MQSDRLQKLIYKLMFPMIFLLPFWLTFGRALLGSAGWVGLIMLFTVAPLLLIILVLFTWLVKGRREVQATKMVSKKDAQLLTVLYSSFIVFGLFVVDGGDTSDSVGSVVTMAFGKSLEPLSNMLAGISFLVACICVLLGFILFISERVESRKSAKI